MKIGYIGVYRDGTGYAKQAINNIRAISTSSLDVVAKYVNLASSRNDAMIPELLSLENKSLDKVDVVIQHVLPHMFEYKHGVKNIGLFDWETSHFKRSIWPFCCNLMDEIWVPTIQNKYACIDSGVTSPIRILPCACDPLRFKHKPLPARIDKSGKRCIFYTIGEMTRRKNIIASIRAFYRAFSARDDVVLIIKTSMPGKTPQQSSSAIRGIVEDIKESTHIYRDKSQYPPIMCITERLHDEQIDQLHVSCDIFISLSHTEAWGIPMHDAMGFGNPVIVSNHGSYPEIVYPQACDYWMPDQRCFRHPGTVDSGWLVPGQLSPCFGQTESFPDLYTGSEDWFDPCVTYAAECMQEAYRLWQDKSLSSKQEAAKNRATSFDYRSVGKIAESLLLG